MSFKEFVLSNMSESEIEKHYSGLAKLAKGLALDTKDVQAFSISERYITESKDDSK